MSSYRLAIFSLVCLMFGCTGGSANDAAPVAPVGFDFDRAPLGPLHLMRSSVGDWTADADHAAIIEHPQTGDRCLHLRGGKDRSVTLDLKRPDARRNVLEFRAERWTSRAPFKFRVEASTENGWKTVYTGDDRVRVGKSLLSSVRISLKDPKITKLRFVSTAPSSAGVLIDEVQLTTAVASPALSVSTIQYVTPVLVGAPSNDLLGIKVVANSTDAPKSVTGFDLSFAGTSDLDGIEKVEVFYNGDFTSLDRRSAGGPFAKVEQLGKAYPPAETVRVECDQTLLGGDNYFWVSCTMKPGADIDQVIDAGCVAVRFSDGTTIKPPVVSPPVVKRIGVAVRQGGDDGAHAYRIPGLATTNKGTLIGVYDIRHKGWGDLPGHIDVGMSRSTDGGRTWEPMQAIMDMGGDPAKADPKWRGDGIGDPAVLVDRETNTIWVAATWSHGNRSWRGSGPGLEPEETGQFMMVKSEDDGKTWSKPINVTKQFKDPAWCFVLVGPGKGITMKDGTLVFAAQYQDPPDKRRLPHSTIIYSKDHGKTWKIGTGAYDDTTESQVVELEPGVLMLNCRYNRAPHRVVMVTRDMGKTWTEHPTSRKALPEPGSCMASLVAARVGDERWLAFSNPNRDKGPRKEITIKLSKDDGKTWPQKWWALLDENPGAGYSCMTMIDEQTIGILYEGSQAHMTFQRLKIETITGHPFGG